MSYYLATEDGFIADFATVPALAIFRTWVEGRGAEIDSFFEQGFSEDPTTLASNLRAAAPAPGDLEEMRALLQQTAENANDVVILTDGD